MRVRDRLILSKIAFRIIGCRSNELEEKDLSHRDIEVKLKSKPNFNQFSFLSIFDQRLKCSQIFVQ